MSAQNSGRQSPPPEESSAKQTGAPSDGQGISQGGDNKKESKDQLAALESNPKGPLDDHLQETVRKTVGPHAGEGGK